MIHANDARRLSEESDANIMALAERIGKQIEAEAGLGKRSLVLDHHNQSNSSFLIEKPPFHPAELTKFQKLVMEYVKKHGYSYKIAEYTYQVGGGIGCMDDTPLKQETGYRLMISW